MKVIGIDIGTTSICGTVLDTDSGKLLKSRCEESDAFIETEKAFEKIQDTKKIISIATDILDSFIDEYGSDTASIGITGQMHGIVYVDTNGAAVSPLYTWCDRRGELPYLNTTYAGQLDSFCGYGNVTDFYNRKNGLVPEVAKAYCTIGDYLGMLLCKRRTPLLHSSNAASLGLYDIENHSFFYPHAPSSTKESTLLGEYRGIPVSVALGDNQASVLATLASDRDLLINIGTGSQVSVISDKPIIASGIESRPFINDKYLIVGAALCGGRAYSLLKIFYDKLLALAGADERDIYAIMSKMLEGKNDTSLMVDTRFDGTRANPAIRGSITNLSVDNFTPENLTLGVLLGIAHELYEMYSGFGTERNGIVASGNGIRKNAALRKIIEQVFSGKTKIPAFEEEAACGAALFSLICTGHKTEEEVRRLIRYI